MEVVVAPATGLVIDGAVGTAPLVVYRRTFPVRLNTSGADRVALDTVVLRVAFKQRDVVLTGGSLSSVTGGVRVNVGTPREVVRVDLRAEKPQQRFGLHRVDGNAIGPETTAFQSGTTVATGFVAPAFVLKGPAPADVASVTVRIYPTGVRLGLAQVRPGIPLDPVFFWPKPGEVKGTVDSGNVGTGLRTALQRLLDGLDTLPAAVDVAVVAESDTPCILDVTTLRVGYHLVRERFADGDADKRTLRFAAGETQQVTVALPAGATVRAASLRTVESFGADRAVDGGATATPGETRGLHVGSDRWVAAAVEPGEPLSASGLALGLAGVVDGTEVMLQVQEDAHGRPSGHALAEAELELEGAERRWVTAGFAGEVTLFPQPYWVVLRAAKGEAVWLVDGGGRTQAAGRADGTQGWEVEAGYDDGAPLARFLSRGREAAALPPATLDVGGTTVVPTRSADEAVYNVGAALRSAGRTEPELAFTAAAAGLMTAYPPVVEYDL